MKEITFFINILGDDTEIHPGQYPAYLAPGVKVYFDSIEYTVSEVQVHLENETKFSLPFNPIKIVRYVLV